MVVLVALWRLVSKLITNGMCVKLTDDHVLPAISTQTVQPITTQPTTESQLITNEGELLLHVVLLACVLHISASATNTTSILYIVH